MVMQGNITINSRPRECDLMTGICPDCCEEVQAVPINESFSDPFGQVEDWSAGCPHCGGEVCEGKIYLRQTKTVTARKEYHFSRDFKIRGDWVRREYIVKKGEKYYRTFIRGYYIDCDGNRQGVMRIVRETLKQPVTVPPVPQVESLIT